MSSNEPHLGWAASIEAGTSPAIADSMFKRAEVLRLTGAPVIYSLKHLALCTGVEYGFLRAVIRRSTPAYRAIRIPKNTGGYRDLLSPTDSLMSVQRWILHEILAALPRHPNNFAYFKEVTPLECASRHVGANWMVKTDLHDYFPSITEEAVFRVFSGLGYSKLLSFELARICTWPRPASSRPTRPQGAMPYTPIPLGALPQGAPTSGALANAATHMLDARLSAFALQRRMVYTRYSDDMTFSSAGPFVRDQAAKMIPDITRIVTSSGLELHDRKTRIVPPGARKIVLGMIVQETRISILPEQRRKIAGYVHAVSEYGPLAYAANRGFDSVLSFVNHVEGWLAYVSYIDPAWTSTQKTAWNTALEKHGVLVGALG